MILNSKLLVITAAMVIFWCGMFLTAAWGNDNEMHANDRSHRYELIEGKDTYYTFRMLRRMFYKGELREVFILEGDMKVSVTGEKSPHGKKVRLEWIITRLDKQLPEPKSFLQMQWSINCFIPQTGGIVVDEHELPDLRDGDILRYVANRTILAAWVIFTPLPDSRSVIAYSVPHKPDMNLCLQSHIEAPFTIVATRTENDPDGEGGVRLVLKSRFNKGLIESGRWVRSRHAKDLLIKEEMDIELQDLMGGRENASDHK